MVKIFTPTRQYKHAYNHAPVFVKIRLYFNNSADCGWDRGGSSSLSQSNIVDNSLELRPNLGSSPELNFKLEVNEVKARALSLQIIVAKLSFSGFTLFLPYPYFYYNCKFKIVRFMLESGSIYSFKSSSSTRARYGKLGLGLGSKISVSTQVYISLEKIWIVNN